MINARVSTGLLDGHQIPGIGHHANRFVLTAWIGANRTKCMVAKVRATLAVTDFLNQAFQGIPQAQGLAGFAAQQMQNQLERGLATNARKSRKGIDGILH
jgi:hypothetical protein